MPIYLKQSTASQEVPLGYFLDSTDGNTEETGLSIANTDIKLWKMSATTLANKNSGGATHISNGIYYAVLDATDTNTLGSLVLFVHVSGALPVRLECQVLTAAEYDRLVGGTGELDIDVLNATLRTVAYGEVDSGTISLNSFPLTLNITPTTDAAFENRSLNFTSGDNEGVTVWITAYNAGTGVVTVSAGLRVLPVAGDDVTIQ